MTGCLSDLHEALRIATRASLYTVFCFGLLHHIAHIAHLTVDVHVSAPELQDSIFLPKLPYLILAQASYPE
jgi:hypothetical protein